MKINEVIGSKETSNANLKTALELLRRKHTSIDTKSLINIVRNTDQMFGYDNLIDAAENDNTVKNLIKSINKKTVVLVSAGDLTNDQETVTVTPAGDATKNPVDTVDSMAKRAAKERGAPVA